MKILGIETSCDETAVAIYDEKQGVIADLIRSQIALHQPFGGVVPELASRDHIRFLAPLAQQALTEAHITPKELDGIAYTAGPGLLGALMVGAGFGRAMGFALQIPTIAIHHMEGHLLAPMLMDPKPVFPFLALLVSGGHTLLVAVRGLGQYEILGESVDDAVGEAFDKTARLLGLPYPGGPAIAECAGSVPKDKDAFVMPRPMLHDPSLNFSFSGLKTHVRCLLQRMLQNEQPTSDADPMAIDPILRADLAHGFQAAVVETLVKKCEKAVAQTGFRQLVVAGGVSANVELRQQLFSCAKQRGFEVFFPALKYCTDNAAMIAYAGYCRLSQGAMDPPGFEVRARWRLSELQPPRSCLS